MTDERTVRRRRIFLAVKLVLALGVLGILFSYVPLQSVYDAFTSASLLPLVGASLLTPIPLLLRINRWKILLDSSGEQQSWEHAARSVVVGYAFSVVTPAEIGDYIARVRLTSTTDIQKIVALTLADKIVYGSLILLLGIPALVSFQVGSAMSGVVTILTGLVLVVFAGFIRRPVLSLPFLRGLAIRFRFVAGLEALAAISGRTLVRIAAIGLGILTTYVLQEFLLLNAFSDVTILQTWQGFWAGMSVRLLAPIFFGDLGIREVTHVYFFGLLGVEQAVALSASLMIFVLNILIPSILGLVVFLRSDTRRP